MYKYYPVFGLMGGDEMQWRECWGECYYGLLFGFVKLLMIKCNGRWWNSFIHILLFAINF